MAHRVLAA